MFEDDPENRLIVEMIKHNRNLFLFEGIAFVLLGIFALVAPTIFSLTLDLFLGWILILGAVALGVRTVRTPSMPNRTASNMRLLPTCCRPLAPASQSPHTLESSDYSGLMFWLTWKKLFGSYFLLTSVSRS